MRKRSRYRPRPVRADVMQYVMEGFKPFTSISYGTTLRLKNHESFASLLKGTADKEDIDTLIGAFNMCEGFVRLRPDLGADWVEEIRAGQDALLQVARRGVAEMRFTCTQAEIDAMSLLMQIHDKQLDETNVREMELAIDIVVKDQKTGKARSVVEAA